MPYVPEKWLADPDQLMAFALGEKRLADEAEVRFLDPIAAKVLRHSADAALQLAQQSGGDLSDYDPYWPL